MNTKELIEFIEKEKQESANKRIELDKIHRVERRRHKINDIKKIILEVGGKVITVVGCIFVVCACLIVVLFLSNVSISISLLKLFLILVIVFATSAFLLLVLNNSRGNL